MALFSNKSCQISRVLETVTSVRQGLYGLVLTATLTIQVECRWFAGQFRFQL